MRNWSENQIKLVLIRHGATASNKEHRYLGRTDEALSQEGVRELQKAKSVNSYPEVACLFSGPMKRCLETAEILYTTEEPIIIPEWKEMDFGAFEGKNYKELQGDGRYQAWIDSNGILPFPEGESREKFIARCEQGFRRMLELLSELAAKQVTEIGRKKQKHRITVGLIVHGGTIMALLSRYCGGEYFDYQVANGRGYICTLRGDIEQFEIGGLEKL